MKVKLPVRIDLSAGWPDSDPFRKEFGGYVLNAAINKYAVADLDEDGLRLYLDGVPRNSGLGTSGALRAAFLGISNPDLVKHKYNLLQKTWDLENTLIEQRAGYQDEAAAIFGGTNLWHFPAGNSPTVIRHKVNDNRAKFLEDHLALIYTGQSHVSSSLHDEVFNRFNYKTNIKLIRKLSDLAIKMEENIGNPEFANCMRQTWAIQKMLGKGIETEVMKKLQNNLRNKYEACRATGAGGGGCMIFYTDEKRAFEHVDGYLPFKFDTEGIKLLP